MHFAYKNDKEVSTVIYFILLQNNQTNTTLKEYIACM
jgi:hypothetical protein